MIIIFQLQVIKTHVFMYTFKKIKETITIIIALQVTSRVIALSCYSTNFLITNVEMTNAHVILIQETK